MPEDATGTSITRCSCRGSSGLAPTSPVSRHHLGEIGRAPKDGIAPFAPVHRNADRLARRERAYERVKVADLDLRHVAQQDQRAIAIRRQRLEARPQRGAQAIGEGGIVHDDHIQAASASATRAASKPVTTTTGSAPLAMAATATRATIAWPPTGSSSLLRGARREERPAASTMAAIFACHQRAPLPRCTAVISATIESAISAAPCAPTSSPIGA